MDVRAGLVTELENLIAQFKASMYTDSNIIDVMQGNIYSLRNTFQFSFGSEFTPTKKKAVKITSIKKDDSSEDEDSSSLSDSESESSEEAELSPPKKLAVKKPRKPQIFIKKAATPSSGGGSSASDSSEEDPEDSFSGEERPEPIRKKKLLLKKKDPNAPKRPMSAFLLFSTEKRVQVKMEHPDWKLMDISRHLAMLWKGMSDSESKIYQEKASQAKLQYEEEMRRYQASVAVQQEKTPAKKATPVKKERKISPKVAKDGPKRPLSAYMFYVIDKREEVKASRPELSLGELAKEMGTMWKDLSDVDKKIYSDKAQADMERYQRELNK